MHSLYWSHQFLSRVSEFNFFEELHHMRFSFWSVFQLIELIWTNNMMVQLDDALWTSYLSVHLFDVNYFAKFVIKLKGIYPQIFVRTSPHLWGNSGQNEQFCLSSWVPCKVSSCSGFPIIHIRKSVISLRCLGTINICWLCFLCQEMLRNMQQVQKDGEFWLVGSKTCENSVFSVVSQNNSKQKILRNWMSWRRLVQNFFKLSPSSGYFREVFLIINFFQTK